ncbi:MAG: hypothetical protein AAFR61_03030 [Bacteroidota bacterium]
MKKSTSESIPTDHQESPSGLTPEQAQLIALLSERLKNGEKVPLSGELCMMITQELAASMQQAQLLQQTLVQSCDHWFQAMTLGLSQEAESTPAAPEPPAETLPSPLESIPAPKIKFRKRKKAASGFSHGDPTYPAIKIVRKK